jgi:hypothetical protein
MTSRTARELIELLESDHRFRVEPTKLGWKVLPPDRTKPPVFISKGMTDNGADAENIRARLRRAGFEFPGDIRTKKDTTMAEAGRATVRIGNPGSGGAPAAAAIEKLGNPFTQATACIERAIEALTELEGVLRAIQAEGEEMRKLKASLAAVLGGK